MKKSIGCLNHVLNFIAVILGVYLAFYVNERAELTGERKERELLMNSMINDLSSDIKTYENYQIPINVRYKENLDTLLALLSEEEIQEVNNRLVSVFQLENYGPSTSTYNSMKSSGKIKLLADLDLQKKLSDYYDGTVLECISKNKAQADFFMNEVLNWLMSNADLMEMKLRNEKDLVVLRNTLIVYQSMVDQKVRNYELIVEESKELKVHLDSLIKRK